jgi:hypothetical protein
MEDGRKKRGLSGGIYVHDFLRVCVKRRVMAENIVASLRASLTICLSTTENPICMMMVE